MRSAAGPIATPIAGPIAGSIANSKDRRPCNRDQPWSTEWACFPESLPPPSLCLSHPAAGSTAPGASHVMSRTWHALSRSNGRPWGSLGLRRYCWSPVESDSQARSKASRSNSASARRYARRQANRLEELGPGLQLVPYSRIAVAHTQEAPPGDRSGATTTEVQRPASMTSGRLLVIFQEYFAAVMRSTTAGHLHRAIAKLIRGGTSLLTPQQTRLRLQAL